jgi:hypothetical protein
MALYARRRRTGTALATEYEQLLQQMLDEGRAKVEVLKGKKGSEKKVQDLLSDMRFVEVELERYQQGMSLFRTKGVPKVGRWGKPETAHHAQTSSE